MSYELNLQELDQLQTIPPYWEPGHWNGHMIGQPLPDEYPSHPHTIKNDRLALLALESYLLRTATVQPIDQYKGGEVFSCDKHEIGSIAIFIKETLTAQGDTQYMANLEKPSSHSSKATIEISPTGVFVRDEWAIYAKTLRLGVVVGNRKAPNNMLGLRLGALIKGRDGRLHTTMPTMIPEAPTTTVGKPQHYRLQSTRRDYLEKTTAIAICMEGEPATTPQTQRRRLRIPLLQPAISA